MQYIGFDIGIRNLAYCIVVADEHGNDVHIQQVRKIDMECKKSEHQKLVDATINVLDDVLHDNLDASKPITVLIESQMTSVMRCIQTVINTFFKVNAKYMDIDMQTRYVSPKIKLSMINRYTSEYVRLLRSPKVSSYKQNKLDAVHFTMWLLDGKKYGDAKVKQQLIASNKPDDECDSLLMTFAYIESKAR
jgi:hypothetical protein